MYLELLKMESRIEDPPVFDPLLTLVAGHAVAQHLGQRRELELLQVAELVGQHVLGQLRIDDGHLGAGAKPRHARLPVLLDKLMHKRRDPLCDVVATQRQGLRPGLLGQSAVFLEVAGRELVRRAVDAPVHAAHAPDAEAATTAGAGAARPATGAPGL